MSTAERRNHDDLEMPISQTDLESILGSLAPLPDESLDLDREIADAIAEELSRKERFRQEAKTSVPQPPSPIPR